MEEDSTGINVPPNSKLGSRSIFVGPTDSNSNTIFNKGNVAIGHGAQASEGGIAIGTNANAGRNNKPSDTLE